jgi:glycosyltransferase involved in cell wall biosynthesis
MKVLLVIDHFGSGGAQRQIVELACGLASRGHSVEMFIYFPRLDFFRARLDEHHIVVHEVSKELVGSARVVTALSSLLRSGAFDVVASYLSTANVYAELACVAAPGTRLVVSERTSFHDDRSVLGALARRLLHVLADRVVANSETQAAWLARKPWLRNRVSCIYNGVDLNEFHPRERPQAPGRSMRLLGVGRIGPEKNLLNAIIALDSFGKRFGYVPEVNWAGERDRSRAGQKYWRQLEALLERLPSVGRVWRWLGVQTDVAELLHDHHALLHPSFYEGLPNAVCEALAAGRPVLTSNVCDHPHLVADGIRGFLFDPHVPESIVAALERLATLDAHGWRSLGQNARAFAAAELGTEVMVSRYEALFAGVVRSHVRA